MATGPSRKNRPDQKGPESRGPETRGQEVPDKDVQDQLKQQLERMEEGEELTAEKAQKLAPQLGNQAIAAILAGNKGVTSTGSATFVEHEEEQAAEQEVEGEDLDEGVDLEGPQLGGGGGGGGAAGGGTGQEEDPWDLGFLFGGDDDDDDDSHPTRRLGRSPIRHLPSPEDPFARDAIEKALGIEDIAPIEEFFGSTPARAAGSVAGDAVYAAVDAALQDTSALGRIEMDPELLVDTAGALDPLGRPAEIGRFLSADADSPRARSLARVLSRAVAALVPAEGGYAAGVARMAGLAVCAEALEGGGERTDRAVSVALTRDAWPDAVAAARKAMSRGRLFAPDLVRRVVGKQQRSGARRLPEPSPLGGRALARVVPLGFIPDIPTVDLSAPPPMDGDLADVDAALFLFTNGDDPREAPADPPVTAEVLGPALEAASDLVNAMGRAQVEFAAAAIAVCRVQPGAPVRAVLVHADDALRQLARAVFQAGKRLESLKDRPVSAAGDVAEQAVAQVVAAGDALRALRAWGFETVAGAMDA